MEVYICRICHNSSSNAFFMVTLVPHSPKNVSKFQLPETVAMNQSFAAVKENIDIVPTAQVEKAKMKDEINNVFLSGAQSRTHSKQLTADIPHSLIAVIISVIITVVFVIICIVGFLFIKIAFHNGERSLIKCSQVAPYEEIKD